MTRHITDTSHRAPGNNRLIHFLALDRGASRARIWDKMDRARKDSKAASRVKQFLRIDRGRSA
ncbi:hypothetical protein [Celeribacter persicus]|uniref:Uncharacterized protein n=1 Tax=Celeribacter persicus TaxID=1651082 RepID=A0A2T5HGW0_9RHOB|nr:hypothetical protein [Celeribacter persicus]PTQ70810.1 hypothetical protein C8N42_109139 [Celeribacter persicus]